MKKLLLLLIAISCLALCGCGGSNDDSGNGLTPEEKEFAEIVYEFQAAINSKDKNIDKAKNLLYADGVYNKETYDQFCTKLAKFLNKAEDIRFVIGDIGVIPTNLDEQADVRAASLITYTYKGEKKTIDELLVFSVIKGISSKRGIKEFKKYNPRDDSDIISAFPPDLN